MPKPEKIANLQAEIHKCIAKGKYKDTTHAVERKIERRITLPDLLYVLKNGRHEKEKDVFRKEFNSWNYAMRGKTVDDKEIRVILTFDQNNMLIITAIVLCPRKKK